MGQTTERKLTTILCADMKGYSKMMEQDEERTLQSLKEARALFQEEIETSGGRIINMPGDAIIADFPSVVKALDCSVTIQSRLNEDKVDELSPQFRIGLNLGDVIIEGSDIFGDGVNIAARLEGLAPVGGVCISGTVYDHIKAKRPLDFEYMGAQHVKNIQEDVDAYALNLSGDKEFKKATKQNKKQKKRHTHHQVEIEGNDEEAQLRRQVKREAGFYRRLLPMGGVILLLFLINIFTSPGYLWFLWPAMPMSVVIAMDAMRVFGRRHSDDWEEKRYQELKQKKGPQ